MKAMVTYDSAYGNTAKIAEAIAEALGSPQEVALLRVDEARPEGLRELDLLVVGSPTQKFSPTGKTSSFLKRIPSDGLQEVKVAAFDTRMTESAVNEIRILAFFVKLFGYAAKPIAGRLEKKGGKLVIPPVGFYVSDTEGPLLEGELERAAEWARQIAATL